MRGHGTTQLSFAGGLRSDRQFAHQRADAGATFACVGSVEEHLPGFRHFMAGDGPSQGPLSQAGERDDPIIREGLSPLARAMRNASWSDPLPGGRLPADNPNIPAGYTYMLQLLGHDVVESAHPISMDWATTEPLEDVRRRPLMLETLYGDGPIARPDLFDIHAPNAPARLFFRLGPMASIAGAKTALRDIPRARLPDGDTQLAAFTDPVRCPLREPVLADARNDDNGILSQLSTLFMLFHNAIALELLNSWKRNSPGTSPPAPALLHIFETTRRLVVGIYRRIVVNDVLKRILHPDVFAIYSSTPRPRLDPVASQSMRPTIEFSFGAFRFGHAMVRDVYTLRGSTDFPQKAITQILNQSSSGQPPTQIPPTADWIIDWKTLFQMPDGTPNLSRRIGPPSALNRSFDTIFAAIDPDGELGLDYRDLVSAVIAKSLSVDALLAGIFTRLGLGEPAPTALRGYALGAPSDTTPDGHELTLANLLADCPLLHNAAYRAKELAQWGYEHRGQMDEPAYSALQALLSSPPLPFFVRFEAASFAKGGGGGGRYLGVLGSILVAEQIFGMLDATRVIGVAYDRSTAALAHQVLSDLDSSQFDDPWLLLQKGLNKDIAGMPELVDVVSALYLNRLQGPPLAGDALRI